ncbi:hypothetical protein MRX96_037355 [Rhipicephalus microplus]
MLRAVRHIACTTACTEIIADFFYISALCFGTRGGSLLNAAPPARLDGADGIPFLHAAVSGVISPRIRGRPGVETGDNNYAGRCASGRRPGMRAPWHALRRLMDARRWKTARVLYDAPAAEQV